MAEISESEVVNWNVYADARTALGKEFARILGYFRDDGLKAVEAIEQAMRNDDARQLVLPAHKLKGEALQFGAEQLAELAELIEAVSRRCVEYHERPDELLSQVVNLRTLFEQTMQRLDMATNPLIQRGVGGWTSQRIGLGR